MSKSKNSAHRFQISDNFLMVPNAVLYDDDLNASEKLIYSIIISLSQQLGYCYKKPKAISLELGLGPQYVRKIMISLKTKKYIRTEGRGTSLKIYPIELYGNKDRGPDAIKSAHMRVRRNIS